MFKGFVLSESLRNPAILNDFEKIYVKVESHPDSVNPFWHLFKIRIDDSKIKNVAQQFAADLRPAWYAHFWNDRLVYISYPGKVMTLPRERSWSSPEYEEVKAAGVQAGVEERYLDFWIED